MVTLKDVKYQAEEKGYHLVVKDRLAYLWKGYIITGDRNYRNIRQCFDVHNPYTVLEYLMKYD